MWWGQISMITNMVWVRPDSTTQRKRRVVRQWSWHSDRVVKDPWKPPSKLEAVSAAIFKKSGFLSGQNSLRKPDPSSRMGSFTTDPFVPHTYCLVFLILLIKLKLSGIFAFRQHLDALWDLLTIMPKGINLNIFCGRRKQLQSMIESIY